MASPRGYPFSQSYRAKLSNSLTRVLSHTLGLLPQPTSVGLRYGRQKFWQRGFSRRPRFNGIPQGVSPKVFSPLSSQNGFAYPGRRLQGKTRHVQWARSAYLLVSPLCVKTNYRRCRNFDLLSIAFACSLRLRPDLPYVDQRCVGNLGLTVSWILTRINATHAGILTSQRSTRPYGPASSPWQRSPTDPIKSDPAASVVDFSPVTFSARDPSTSELLRTLQRVAASKPTS